MISEERVREMTRMAIYEQNEGKQTKPMEKYFRNDYVGKEMLKSFVTGTLAYLIIAALRAAYVSEDVTSELQRINYGTLLTELLISYVLFMTVYLVITYAVYSFRYTKGRKNVKKFYMSVKKVNQMYRREE